MQRTPSIHWFKRTNQQTGKRCHQFHLKHHSQYDHLNLSAAERKIWFWRNGTRKFWLELLQDVFNVEENINASYQQRRRGGNKEVWISVAASLDTSCFCGSLPIPCRNDVFWGFDILVWLILGCCLSSSQTRFQAHNAKQFWRICNPNAAYTERTCSQPRFTFDFV